MARKRTDEMILAWLRDRVHHTEAKLDRTPSSDLFARGRLCGEIDAMHATMTAIEEYVNRR